MKKVLTIAGSDSGAGAGIQADLKTFAALEVYGTSAITAITAQNTTSIKSITTLPAKVIENQIDAIMEDIGADVWKTGMLANEEIIETIAKKAKQYKIKFLVVDPVMVSKNGNLLLGKNALKTLVKKLLPLSYILTPNLDEAEALIGKSIKTVKEMQKAATEIYKMGAKNVVLKGGHLPKTLDAIDILYNGREFKEFKSKRIKTKNDHGTGCTFSSAIAAFLAKGKSAEESVAQAKKYITTALSSSRNLNIGLGHGPLDHTLRLGKD